MNGQNDRAFAYLDDMVRQDGPESAWHATTDLYARLQSDPRYPDFLARNGYAPESPAHVEFQPTLPPRIITLLTSRPAI
jgi:hypothetical protein